MELGEGVNFPLATTLVLSDIPHALWGTFPFVRSFDSFFRFTAPVDGVDAEDMLAKYVCSICVP